MTRTRYTLDDLGGALSERALLHFIERLPQDSATWAETHDNGAEMAAWASSQQVPMLLAAISDQLGTMIWRFEQAHSKNPRAVKRPEPIPRPGVRAEARRYGSGPVAVKDFDRWWRLAAHDGKH